MWQEPRTYRSRIHKDGFVCFNAVVKETDLLVLADSDYSTETLTILYKYRFILDEYISKRPSFKTSLEPLPQDDLAPPIVKDMIQATLIADVGPMASVAGAFSQYIGMELLKITDQVIVENGGDNYLSTKDDLTVGLYAGNSPLSNKINLRIRANDMPIGICTSSGTVGHSYSMGKADAVCVLSKSAILADAAATAIGNRIKTEGDLHDAVSFGMDLTDEILGVIAIIGSKVGAAGAIELC